jgi:hypothetical protein
MIRNAAFALIILAIPASAFSQIGPPPSPPGESSCAAPISGRNQQNGSVSAVQLPVPGTTTSVNTLIHQSWFRARTGSAASSPTFNGKLSSGCHRPGAGYNLGPVGLNEILRQAWAGQGHPQRCASEHRGCSDQQPNRQIFRPQVSGSLRWLPVSHLTVVGPFNYRIFACD